MAKSKAAVIFGAVPGPGHFNPTRAVAKGLIARGYEVTFIAAASFRDQVEDIGAIFVPMGGRADLTSGLGQKLMTERLTKGKDMLKFMTKEFFVGAIPDQFEALQTAMKAVDTSKPVVIVSESLFLGSLPSILGAGIQPTAHLSIGVVPLFISSSDTAPFGPGLPPDSTPDGRKKNVEMTKQVQAGFYETQSAFHEVLEKMGARNTDLYWMDAAVLLPDRYIQMCLPCLEYPRGDPPSTIRFSGGLGPNHHDATSDRPPWWEEIIENSRKHRHGQGKKHVVTIAQGTAQTNPKELIIPSLIALNDRDDVIAVAILGKKESTLSHDDFPTGTMIPTNARVIDFFPYNDILGHSDIFITNGGYGGFLHAVGNGVPLIVAGATQDKPEVAMRVEWAGLGKNMRTNLPTVEALRAAVDEILGDGKYAARSKELAGEMAKFDPIGIVADNIDELVAEENYVT